MRNGDAAQPTRKDFLWNFSKCLYDIWLSALHVFVMWCSAPYSRSAVAERVLKYPECTEMEGKSETLPAYRHLPTFCDRLFSLSSAVSVIITFFFREGLKIKYIHFSLVTVHCTLTYYCNLMIIIILNFFIHTDIYVCITDKLIATHPNNNRFLI